MDRPRSNATEDQSSDDSDMSTSESSQTNSSSVVPKKKSSQPEQNRSPVSPVNFVGPTREQVLGIPVSRPTRESVLKRLSEALMRRSLTKIDLSQRSLRPSDAKLVKMALFQNSHLCVLKLCYNNLGDEGAVILAPGIASHKALESLDLGFNNIGDEGCRAVAGAILKSCCPESKNASSAVGNLHTLYLAGNLIGEDGAQALADVVRKGCSLKRIHLTGNRIGPDGVTAITEAVIEEENRRQESRDDGRDEGSESNFEEKKFSSGNYMLPQSEPLDTGLEELFLGGTSMGSTGCMAVSRMLKRSTTIRKLSLANCSISDKDLEMLSSSMKENRNSLPLESLQLSFNDITAKGLDSLMNSIWGSTSLRELLLDNNKIGDRGAQQLAAILPHMKTLHTLDVGFNSIRSSGIKTLMKVVAQTQNLVSLSVSGNTIDNPAAKVVAYALAYSRSLENLSLVRCQIEHGGQRHIAAGVVSNSGTSLRNLTGFKLGPILVTIGLPEALQNWSNEQVLNFIHLMWESSRAETKGGSEESELDPLNFLPNGPVDSKSERGPIEAAVVVEVAKRAFASLRENAQDVLAGDPNRRVLESPLAKEVMTEEATDDMDSDNGPHIEAGAGRSIEQLFGDTTLSGASKSFIVPPPLSAEKSSVPDPLRKRRMLDWLSSNVRSLNELEKRPFDSSELWRLHQHYFSPVVNETGGDVPGSPAPSSEAMATMISSVPEVSRRNRSLPANTGDPRSVAVSDNNLGVPVSDPFMASSPPQLGSLPLLKRKVSYRFLGDATISSRQTNARSHMDDHESSVSKLIGQGKVGSSLPPKSKRARRNKTRISFLPRVKAKLDSFLDIDHDKALVLMRKLFFVEQAILGGKINPCEQGDAQAQHLAGDMAADAETILIDLM